MDRLAAKTVWLIGALGLAVGAAACHAPPPVSPAPRGEDKAVEDDEDRAATPWSKCYESFTPSGDPVDDVRRIGLLCGPSNGQKPLSEIRSAPQSENEAVDRYTFTAGGEGKCYRVFGVGDTGVRDLDLQVVGPGGELVAADVAKDAWPVLPPRGPLCLKDRGVYTLEVSVYRGSGKYAVQVWTN
jgi:hypothetical protein